MMIMVRQCWVNNHVILLYGVLYLKSYYQDIIKSLFFTQYYKRIIELDYSRILQDVL